MPQADLDVSGPSGKTRFSSKPCSNETDLFDELLTVPSVSEWISPLLTVVPMQLLSYHIAAHRGLDVDQPRNLVKSVTVE